MIQLTQGMYADLNCRAFGLSYGQNRQNDIIRNAGWFNHRGEKLGFGDLSLHDIDNIAADIPDDELFIILNEGNTTWNMPSGMDRFKPGIDYVMNHASWLVSGFKATQYNVYAVKDYVKIDITTYHDNAHKLVTDNGIEYYEATRDFLFKAVGYVSGGFVEVSKPINVVRKEQNYFGLDVYEFPDGVAWAIADNVTAFQAAKSKLESQVHLTDLYRLRNYIPFLREDIPMLEHLADNYGSKSAHIFQTILGGYFKSYIEDEVLRRGCGSVLANYDGLEYRSDSITGLPKGFYAYRID